MTEQASQFNLKDDIRSVFQSGAGRRVLDAMIHQFGFINPALLNDPLAVMYERGQHSVIAWVFNELEERPTSEALQQSVLDARRNYDPRRPTGATRQQ